MPEEMRRRTEKQAILRNVSLEITIVTWAPDSYGYGDAAFWLELHENMRQAGFYLKTTEEFCAHFAIIDQELVWYGSMNLLAKEKIEDNMMRIKSKHLAAELMEFSFSGERH